MQDSSKLRGSLSEANEDCVVCHITELEAISDRRDDRDRPQYACHYDSTLGYRDTLAIRLPRAVVEPHRALIESGTAHFCIPSAYRVDRALIVPSSARLEPHHDHRQLVSHKNYTIGTKRVLAVRVTTAFGEEPAESLDEIGRAVFGFDWVDSATRSTASVVQQYRDVSHGQLDLVPATGSGVFDGIIQVQLDTQVAGKEVQRDLTGAILNATQAALGSPLEDVAEHFIFCLPDSSLLSGDASWTAFTYLFEPYSYYQQSRCTKLSVVMHEFGHSLGFRHSGYEGNEYADESGYMGYAANEFGWPRKAFNAHKHWISSWFADRSLEVYPNQAPVVGNLMSFVDYGNEAVQANDVVVLRAGNLYIHYNRAKGYNPDTPSAYSDRVVVTESPGDLEVSNFIAALSTGQSYFYPNFSGSDTLVIEVCDQITGAYDYAVVSLFIEGMQKSQCDQANIKLGAPADSYQLDTSHLGNDAFVSEDTGRSERDPTRATVGIVWAAVAVLFFLALYLVYRLRRQVRGANAGKPEAEERRKDWIPSTIETVSRSTQEEEVEVEFGSDDSAASQGSPVEHNS